MHPLLEIKDPELERIQKKAEEISTACNFNEAVRTIDGLIDEVRQMTIAARFSKERKAYADLPPRQPLRPELANLSEAEFKRAQLIRDLEAIRNKIISTSGDLQTVIMDMEATKRD